MREIGFNASSQPLIRLWQNQSAARFAKLARLVRSPRQRWLTVVAVVLGFIWLGQAFLGVVFRSAADPERLAVWIPIGLFAYTFWHFLKTFCGQSSEPFEWTPAEKEWLFGAPISRSHLILYRLAGISLSLFLKSFLFSILMLPDLRCLPAGFIGIFIGLALIELLRMAYENLNYGLSRNCKRVIRWSLVVGLSIWVGLAFCISLYDPNATQSLESPSALAFAIKLMIELIGQIHELEFLMWPFKLVAGIMLTEQMNAAWFAQVVFATSLVVACGFLVVVLDRFAANARLQREASVFVEKSKLADLAITEHVVTGQPIGTFKTPLRLRGIGSIAWRQLMGAYHYRSTLAVSLGIPVFLCLLPLLADHSPFQMTLHLVAAVTFYSFLLLPPALMLDFRRDVHRLDVLKSLPIGPMEITLGQLAAPVLLCSVFHWIVFSIAIAAGAISLVQGLMAIALLIPVSLLIFAIENSLFMVSPFRRNQEGLQMFLRTILTFTAKGILFSIALAMVVAWALFCRFVDESLFSNSGLPAMTLFGVGVAIATIVSGWFAIAFLARLYERFDPSADAISMS